jgi:8-oxo-dGTP diphosphatase
VRCLDTVQPFASAIKRRVRLKSGLSEEGFAAQPDQARYHLTRLLERGNPALVCSHGPVLPALLEHLAAIADPDGQGTPAEVTLSEAAANGMGKGEALVAHITGTGPDARVVDVERHLAP